MVESVPSKATVPLGHTAREAGLPSMSLHLIPPASSLMSINGAESEVGRALAWHTEPWAPSPAPRQLGMVAHMSSSAQR